MAVLLAQSDARRIPIADRSVDLVLGSPPYADARLYLEKGVDLGISRNCRDWVSWMLRVTAESLRVSRGAVLWVAAGVTRDRTYWPACEGLMWRWYDEGWTEHGPGTADDGSAYRPCYWHRVGIFGSGGDQWFRADVEYAMCFKRPGSLPFTHNTAMGVPPKWKPGGQPSHRGVVGERVNKPHTKAEPDGTMRTQYYNPPDIANPGNLVSIPVGGGRLGHDLAHENEAPFPEDLAEHFIRSLCPEGGTVLDPFSGSGTSVSVAERFGRIGIGLDLRRSQAELARRRIERPHAPVIKQSRAATETHPLFDVAS